VLCFSVAASIFCSTWIRRIPVFKKGPRGPSNAGEKALMLL
jgi:hypothetical protein